MPVEIIGNCNAAFALVRDALQGRIASADEVSWSCLGLVRWPLSG